MDVISLIKHSLITDNSNPITKHFQLGKQTGSGGPEMVWKIYDAVRIKDKTPASVFVFEKKIADKIHKPKRRDIVSEILRKDVRLLSRLRHPRILRVIHPIEECYDSVSFAVEPVVASVANLLGNHDRLPSSVPSEIKDHNFLETEIKCGLLGITEAISFLHNVEHMLHMNLSPSNIFATQHGVWKLAGFGFAERPLDGICQDNYPAVPWTPEHHKMAQPDMDYMAPEIQLETTNCAGPSCDMFSLGMVICSLYNSGRSLIQADHTQATYAKQVDRMTELFGEIASRLPAELVEPVEKMINRDVRYRPTAQLFMLLKYFDDPVAQCMRSLDSVDSQDLSQRCEFFTRLAQTIPTFPKKLLYKSVLPMLVDQLHQPDALILVLPSMLSLVSNSSPDEYRTLIQSHLAHVFNMARPMQATVFLLDNLDIILAKATEEEVRSYVLPMIFSTLESNSIQGHEAAIGVFSIIRKYMDEETIRKLLLPKAKALFSKSTNVRTKLNALACVDRLLDSLDKMIILDEVIPFLTEITCSDVDIVMSVTAIYQHLLSDRKFGLTYSLLASKIMPTLIPLSVCPGLSIDQFNVLMDLLRGMLSQIDRQRRIKMVSEAPDTSALELRTNLQQLHSYCTATNRTPNIRLPEEYAVMSRSSLSPRPSIASSNSSIGSSYSRHGSRQGSVDMKYGLLDPSRLEASFGNKYLLTVDEAYYNRCRRGSMNRYGYRQAPSTPELQTKGSSKESLNQSAYKRYSSFQGLGAEEQAVLDKIVRERRASLAPRSAGGTPHITVSAASLSDQQQNGWWFLGPLRRASTQSMGPVAVPEPGRRDSRGKLLDCLQDEVRRSSFQGICESAVQFFVGK